MVILGINGTLDWVPEPKNWLHGSSVTLVIDGVFVCSLEQERFSRKKYDGNFPQKCIDNLLNKYNLKYEDVDIVSYVGGATLKNLEYRHTGYTQKFLKNIFKNSEIFIIDHHTAHMFGSFLSSNFDESNVITLDSGGDYYPCFPDMFGNSFNLNMGSFGRIHLNPFKV
jgi:carbamoyltransferase